MHDYIINRSRECNFAKGTIILGNDFALALLLKQNPFAKLLNPQILYPPLYEMYDGSTNPVNLSILYPWFIHVLVYFYSWKHSWMHIGPSLCNIKCLYEWSGCIFISIFLTFPRVHYLKIIHGLANKFVFPWVMYLASEVHLVWIFLH